MYGSGMPTESARFWHGSRQLAGKNIHAHYAHIFSPSLHTCTCTYTYIHTTNKTTYRYTNAEMNASMFVQVPCVWFEHKSDAHI